MVLFCLCKTLVLCKARIFESVWDVLCSVFRSGFKLFLSPVLVSDQGQVKDREFRAVADLKGRKLRKAPGLGFKFG